MRQKRKNTPTEIKRLKSFFILLAILVESFNYLCLRRKNAESHQYFLTSNIFNCKIFKARLVEYFNSLYGFIYNFIQIEP